MKSGRNVLSNRFVILTFCLGAVSSILVNVLNCDGPRFEADLSSDLDQSVRAPNVS